MAPLEKVSKVSIGESRRQNSLIVDDATLRGRKNDDSDDSSDGKGRRKVNNDGSGADGGGNGSDDGSGGKSPGKNRNKDDSPDPKSAKSSAGPPPDGPAAVASSTTSSIAPSTTATTSSSSASSTAAASSSTSGSTSSFPTTQAPSATPFIVVPSGTSADTSSQPRKGMLTFNGQTFTTMSPSTSSIPGTVTMTEWATATPALPTSLQDLGPLKPNHNKDGNGNRNYFNNGNGKKGDGLSTTAERVLIAVGSIGGFIILLAVIFLFLRMKGINVFGGARRRKVRRGGPRGQWGWRKESGATSTPPPEYGESGNYGFPPDEKKYSDQNQYDGSSARAISPAVLPPLAIPETTAFPQRVESPDPSQPLTRNVQPYGTYSPSESPIEDPAASYNLTGRRNTMLSGSNPESGNNTMDTQNTQTSFLTRQTSKLQPSNRTQIQHMSYLSSLSSGFGDGLMPDPNAPMQGYRESRAPGTFSWMQGPGHQQHGNRDTVYTTTSEESAPRFRTVNSWVAQQAGRVEARPIPGQNVPSVPAIPVDLQADVAQFTASQAPAHQRNTSEDPVFKYHPGDEVQIDNGVRVASTILNTKTGRQ